MQKVRRTAAVFGFRINDPFVMMPNLNEPGEYLWKDGRASYNPWEATQF